MVLLLGQVGGINFLILSLPLIAITAVPRRHVMKDSQPLLWMAPGPVGILASCCVDVAGFHGATAGTGVVGVYAPAMGGAEASNDTFVLECRADL